MISKRYGAAIALAAMTAAGYALWRTPEAQAPHPDQARNLLLQIPADVPRSAGAGQGQVQAHENMTERLVNPLERSANLRSVYDKFKDSKDASERSAAYRAWSACFPTFLGPQGQVASLESVTRALPTGADAAQRADAYRALMGRCKGFFDLPRGQLLQETAQQKSGAGTGAALAPGELANKYLLDGDAAKALQAARAVIASRDPAAIDSLHEFVNQYLSSQIDAQQLPRSERVDLRALAFSMAACKMGMECGPDSLTALQLCANSGACSGNVSERYLHGLADDADRERLLAESERVVAAIKSGNYKALGL
jgi:hypothetical protein